MKITPVKNYKKPMYAIKLAALVTAAASLSGCAERILQPSGMMETREPEGAGAQVTTTSAETTTVLSSADTTKTTTTSATTEVTTTVEDITCVEIGGDVAVETEETRKNVGLGLFTAAAVTTTVAATVSETPPETEITELAGDVPEPLELEGEPVIDEEDLNPVGIVPAYIDDDIIELEGDVEAPTVDFEEEIPNDYILADSYEDKLKKAFEQIDGIFERIDGDYPFNTDHLMTYGDNFIYARYMYAPYEKEKPPLYITFVSAGTPEYDSINNNESTRITDYAFMREMNIGEDKVNVVILVENSFDYVDNYAQGKEIPDICADLVNALEAKGIIQ
ncbi:MAG: hypothetical protein II820_03615 [Ruminiclostridium sp.]|nr:hypothetical protein [Ruminiclostridium sp.]